MFLDCIKKIYCKMFLMFIFCLFSFLMFSCSDSTAPPDNGSLDTTSHNFNWTVDTIGDGTTWLNCVSIINEDNIWIGGSINSGNSNVMHWNGKEWEYIQIRDEQYNICLLYTSPSPRD